MLLQFNVKNYSSIKDEILLSLVANADKEHSDSLIFYNNERVLPTIAIYGANAAGKSNIFKAITMAINLVRFSNNLQINSPIPIIPFLLDKTSITEKTKLDFTFINNGIKYEYGFTADQINIYDEYLYEYRSSRPTTIFERTDIDKYKFTVANAELKQYAEKNTHNKLFLCTATAWNCKLTRNAFMWFAEGIDTFYSLQVHQSKIYYPELDKHKDDIEFKKALLEMLKHADVNISDYKFEAKDVDDLSQIQLPPGVVLTEEGENLFKNMKGYHISSVHSVQTESGKEEYEYDFDLESDGTKALLAYAPIILDALRRGRTIIVDEIDSCLHPILLEYLIGIFHDSSINVNGAQLIFSTHDVTLLDLDKFRRDQIYFVEKNNSTGVTTLYSLADFKPRKTENVRKGYMQGRFGAIPIVVGGYEWAKE